MRALLFAIGVAGVAGCSKPDCDGTILPYQSSYIPFFRPGVPYTADVSVLLAVGQCRKETVRVYGAVVDGANNEVESEWTVDPTRPGVATLHFLPIDPQPHHVSVRFEPSLELVQFELRSEVISTRPALAQFVVPPGVTDHCSRGHLLPSGTLVCTSPESSRVQVVFDGGVVQAFEGIERALFATGAVWLQAGTNAERWVDTGQSGGLIRTHAWSGNTKLVAATETTAFGAAEGLGPRDVIRFDIEVDAIAHRALGYTVPIAETVGGMSADAGAWWSVGGQTCLNPIEGDAGQRCFGGAEMGNVDLEGVWRPGTPNLVTPTLDLQRDDGSLVSAPTPTRELGLFPLTWLLREPYDVTLAVPVDGGFQYEAFGDEFVGGTTDGDKLLLFSPGKVTVFQR